MISIKNNLRIDLLVAGSVGVLLGLVALLSSPYYALAVLLGIVLALVVVRRPDFGVIALIIITSTIFRFDSFPGLQIGFGTIYLSDILLFTLLSVVVVRLLIDKTETILHSPLSIPIFLFVGIALFSTFLAISKGSLTLTYVLGPARTIANYLTFFVVFYLCFDKGQIKNVYNGIILGATFVAILMVLQFIAGPSTRLLAGRIEILSTEGSLEPGATRIIPPGYPLITIAFISMMVSFVLEDFRKIKLIKLLQWGLIGLGVLITYKRHIWGVVAISVFIMLFIISWKQRVRIFLLGQTLMFSIVAVSFLWVQFAPHSKPAILAESFVERVGSLFQGSTYEANSSLRWRDFEYEYAIPQIISHPVIGLGLGALYRPFIPHRDHEGFDGRGFIHNGHIAIMVKSGLLDYLCFIWLAAMFLYRSITRWRDISDPVLQTIVVGLALSFLALFLGSVIEPMIVEWDCTALLGIMVGINEAIILYHGKQRTNEVVV